MILIPRKGNILRFFTKQGRIERLQFKIEVTLWEVLFDLRKHDRLTPKIARWERKLHKLGGKRLDA